ncbi:hypothetical protein HAX54_013049 [Datura stramonium]|uniref:Uncharacterized protein n=1 Tax=Datura stramonium TaxID=4076 RepID=A0ABS8Y5K7_DATST|nr:hypothetical protein [Datura stramonium]
MLLHSCGGTHRSSPTEAKHDYCWPTMMGSTKIWMRRKKREIEEDDDDGSICLVGGFGRSSGEGDVATMRVKGVR